jgi:hypothetical protein
MNDWSPDLVLQSIVCFKTNWMTSVCDKIKLLENVSGSEQDTEWDNLSCVLIDTTIKTAPEFHLFIKISRVATVATTYWIKYENRLIGSNLVSIGNRVIGDISEEAFEVQNEVWNLLHLNGCFVVPKSEFQFSIIVGSGGGSPRAISGEMFFFGSTIQ